METVAERRYVDALKQASLRIKALADNNAALRAQGAIAVIGMGCRFPGGASDPRSFWDLLAAGGDAAAEFPPDRLDLGRWFDDDPNAPGRIYVRSASLLADVRGFDARFFAITPQEAVALDPQQRLLLEVSWETFEDAGLDAHRQAGSRTGVFLGTSNYDYIRAHIHSGDPARITAYSGSGVMLATAAGRLSYFYDLRGPCLTLDTACSSSLVALDSAIKALRRRDCDLALAGGVSLCLSPECLVALCKVRALSADGRSRAFDDAASGYGRGEGCGLVLLKRLEDARRDGDVVHAVLAGSAVAHDGRSNGLTAPNGLAQQAVIRAALHDAGCEPDDIDYVEAHGTGTSLGDPIEFGALAAVFGSRAADAPLRLGSVKTNIGHTEAAAGIAGLLKVILALRHGALPPSLHFSTPNRHIDWTAPLEVVAGTVPWPAGGRTRMAGVSAFGLSGTNAHVVVAEPPAPPEAAASRHAIHVLPLSAASEAALADLATAWLHRLDGADDADVADLCAVAARRSGLRHRRVVVGSSAADLVAALRKDAAPVSSTEPGLLSPSPAVDDARETVDAAAAFWRAGGEVDWAARAGPLGRSVVAPLYPFQRQPYWLELGAPRPDGCQTIERATRSPTIEVTMPHRDDLLPDLVDILVSVTGFGPDEISPTQHLMDMGLDSLMLLRIGQAVERRFGVELRMSQLFKELGTLTDIAAYLQAQAVPSPRAPAREAAPDRPAPATASANAPLFEQQLQAMTRLAEQSLHSLTELTRQQLAAAGTSATVPRDRPTPPVTEDVSRAYARPKPPLAPPPKPVAELRGFNLAGTRLTQKQQSFVEVLVRRHVERTGRSKALTAASRDVLADWKQTLSFWGQLKEAKYPIVSAASAGARVTDIDGNDYIDVAMGMGVHVFGHNPAFIHDALRRQMAAGLELGTQSPLTGQVARLLTALTGSERVAFSNTGSEAVMVALRLARAATGRSTIVIFENSYHGIFDGVLAANDDGAIVPIGLGTPPGMVEDVVVLPYGAPAALDVIERLGDRLAAVLVEPVQSRDPDLQPQGFLKALRRLTRACGAALVFDETINGFRIDPGGAQAWFGVAADIVVYGKIVGGGMPIGVVAGSARYLDYIDGGAWEYGDRSGPRSALIYFGGTFCRNPATMVAALAALEHMRAAGPALQQGVSTLTTTFCDRLNHWLERERVPLRARHFSSQWRLVPVGDGGSQPIELELLYLGMMIRGIYTWERRISFFSTAHTADDAEAVFAAITGAIADIRAGGFAWSVDAYPEPQFTPPSSTQRRLYALSQREGGERPYHLPQAFVVEGPLDADRLEEAFRTVILRHESLRTAFVAIDGEILAKRVAEPRFAIERIASGGGSVEAAVVAFVRPFDLAVAPLLRVRVTADDAGRTLLLVDAHHIVVDGLSFDIVAGELMAAYAGRPLDPIGYDLRQALASTDAGAAGDRGAVNAAFWRAELDALPDLALSLDRPRPAERDFAGDTVSRTIPAATTARLKALGRQRGASLYMVLLAAWSGLLHRLTGQDDIVVGGAVSGRDDEAAAQAVGMFVNTVAFRTRPRAETGFMEHLTAVARTCLAVYDHADIPFEAVVALAAAPAPGRDAVFDTMLSYENASARTFNLELLRLVAQDAPTRAAMVDLALEVTERDGALTLHFHFADALFDRRTIEHWSASFEQMLSRILDDPDRPLGRIDLLTAADRDLIATLNDTTAGYPAEATLVDLFATAVVRHPERAAVVFGERLLTYAVLDRRSDGLAAALVARMPAGACIGMLLPRSDEAIVAQLAILKAGCVYVPLDPDSPEALLDHALTDSGCAAVITSPETEDRLPTIHRGLAVNVAARAGGATRRARDADDVAYMIYTSGSTGAAKGCLVTHRNVVRLLVNDRMPFGFGPADVWICAHAFAFDFSIWEVWGALAHGGSVVIATKDEARDPDALLALLRRHRVSVLNQTPAAFHGLIEAERRWPAHDLADHLHTVIFGGDRLEPLHLRPWAALYPLDRVALVNMYGITETTVHVTHHRLTEHDLRAGTSPIGRPLPETTIDVLGPGGLPQPIGVPGELWVGGTGVCRGYHDRPALTAERFVVENGRRLYRTGDVGRLRADGVIEYRGRNDRQVQIRGHRVELAAIEHRLHEHPGVDKAVVIARDTAPGNLAGQELVAYVVGDAALSDAALRAHLQLGLPGHAVPSHFVALARLPLTANGKLDRAALPAPEAGRLPPGGGGRPPRGTVEATVAAIWAEVLRLPSVGAEQNYMALGGDSIKALRIVAKLHRAGIAIGLGQMLAAKTVAGVAALAGTVRSADPSPDRRTAPSTPVQRWFAATHGSAPDHFNNAVLLATEAIDVAALERAVAAVVAHHDALRLALDLRAEPPVQHVAASLAVPVKVVEVEDAAALTAHAHAAQRGFDIARAPLLRVVVYRMGGEARLLLLCHHLVVDGISWRILLEDLGLAYETARAGFAPALPPVGLPWLAWSAVLERAARAEALHAERPCWRHVEDAIVPPLPCDYDDPVNAMADAGSVCFELATDATRHVLALASREEAGVAPLLLAALALACRTCFGLERIRVRLEGHGREDLEPGLDLSRTIGWFTTLFPCIVDIGDAATLDEACARVAATLLAVPRKGIGYGLLRYLAPGADKAPRFGLSPEIGFNYLGQFDAAPGGGFTLAPEPLGETVGATLRRPELIDVEAMVVEGRLSVTICYGRRLHARDTIEGLAAAMREALAASAPEPGGGRCDPDLAALAGVPAEAIEAVLALSPLQEGMLFHALEGGRRSYVQQFVYRLNGRLDLDAFAAAWQALVARHQAFRAAFVVPPEGTPRQLVLADRPIPVRRHDFAAMPAAQQAAAVDALAGAEHDGGFDLARDPLMRVALARLGNAATDVIWTSHHIILDGWSLGIAQAELMAIHAATAAGRRPMLPPAPPLSAHLDWLARQDGEAARRFWRARLADAPALASIPGLDAARRGSAYERAEHGFTLDPVATAGLSALAARLEVTLNIVVQGLWAVLLAGFGGADEVMFGAIVSGRPPELPDMDRMIGLFLQPVPVRVRLAPGDDFGALVRRMQADAAEAEAHQHLPLAEMQRLFGPRRLLFDHVVVFENYPFAATDPEAGVVAGDVRSIEQMHYDHGLVVHPGERLAFSFPFNRRVVAADEFVRIEAQLRTLVAAVLADAGQPLDAVELGVRPAAAIGRRQTSGTVLDLFETQAAARPEATAVEAAGQCVSYRALDERADSLADALCGAGAGPGTIVALALPNGVDHIASLLAVWKAGAIAVPLDPDAPARRLRRQTERVGPAAWVTDAAGRAGLVDALGDAPEHLAVWNADGTFDGLAQASAKTAQAARPGAADPAQTARPGAADPAYVMFTSGSSGEPKPILSSHEALRHFIDWERDELASRPGLRVASLALPTFDVSLRDLFLPLASGGIVCAPPSAARGDGVQLAAWLADAAIAILHVVPSVFRLVLKALEERPVALPALRHVLFAGEMLRGLDVERTRRAIGAGVTIRNLYGPSETTLAKCCLRVGAAPSPGKAVPVGTPLPGTRVLVVKDGRLAAPGAIGELHIAPPFVPLGYFRDPDRTADRFVPCPDEWGGGIVYRTGDLGRTLADGTIEVCGRQDGQVKVNGVRVELGEIEQAALECPELSAAVAVAHMRDDGDVAVACYYTLKQPLEPATLRRRLALALPRAAMPHFLVPLEALPLGLNGKVERRALPKPEDLVTDRIPYVEPEGDGERRIAAIWTEVLGLARVGAKTPFFDVGGDSLRAIRVLTRVNAELGTALTIGAFFAEPTVRAMAAARRPLGIAAAIPALPVAADYPVSHAQKRLWMLAQLGGNPAAYTLPGAFRLDGPLDTDALVDALEALADRHEALRTVFVATPEGPRQRVLAQSAFRVARVDLTGSADPDAAAMALARRQAEAGFDLAEGPLIAARLVALAPARHLLLVAVHHIVSDAVSVTVMVEEIVRLARGHRLPPLRVHAKDHAAAEAAWLGTAAAAAMRDWWHRQLAMPPAPLDLPFDRAPPELPSHDGARVGVVFDPGATAGLRELARAAGGTLFAALLALVALVLRRHTGAEEMLLGTPVSCRDDAELETQVGFYVNLLPLRIAVPRDQGFVGFVAEVKRVLAAAIDHRAYPIDRLVEELRPARDSFRPALFDVAVVLQDAGQRGFSFDGVDVTVVDVASGIAKFPLTFEFVETAAGVALNLEYATDLFDRARIARMAGHVATLMAAAVVDPTHPVTTLAMLDAVERALLPSPGPLLDLPDEATIPAVFASWMASRPDAPAVVREGTRLSYAELHARAESLASGLARAGVARGDVVAVLLDRSEQLVAAFLGILRAGAVYLPLDPTYPAERLATMLADSSARLLLTDATHAGDLPDAGCRTIDIAEIAASPDDDPAPPGPRDLAYLIYTSGSTGRPKGVMLEHRGAVNLAFAQRHGLGITADDRVLQFALSSFDASVWEMVMALANGACLVIATAARIREPDALAALLAAERVTVATLPPTYLAELDDAALAPLRLLVTAGEPPDAARAIRLARTMTVVNAYGPTEATVCASWHRVEAEADPERAIPIGRAIGNAALLVLDGDGNAAPLGVEGEIHIAGTGLARGYHDRPDLTAAAFVPHPFAPGERLYRTGDRGVAEDDRTIRFTGRKDRQVKLRGHRVELGEVERAVARHPAVAQCTVAVRQRPGGGELVAFVVQDGPLDEATLRDALARTLPAAMVPARWVMLEALPLLPNGKVDHARLPDEPVPVAAFDGGDRREMLVAEIWGGVLGHRGFGRNDRFFAVGGDSIRAIQVLGRLRVAGHVVAMRAFLAAPTVTGLAALLAEAGPAPATGRLDMAEAEGLFRDE